MQKALQFLNEEVFASYPSVSDSLNQTIADYIMGKISFEEADTVVNQEAHATWCNNKEEGLKFAELLEEKGYTDEMKRFIRIMRRIMLAYDANCLPLMLSDTELDIIKFYDDSELGEEALIEDMARCLRSNRYGKIPKNKPGTLPAVDESQGEAGGYVEFLAQRCQTSPAVFEKLADGGNYFFMTYLYCSDPKKYKKYGDNIAGFAAKKHNWDSRNEYDDDYHAKDFFYAYVIFRNHRNPLVNEAVTAFVRDNHVEALECLEFVHKLGTTFTQIGETLANDGLFPIRTFLSYIVFHNYNSAGRDLIVKYEQESLKEIAHIESMISKGHDYSEGLLKFLYSFWEAGIHIDMVKKIETELIDVFCDYFNDAVGLRDFLTLKSDKIPVTKRVKYEYSAVIKKYDKHIAYIHKTGLLSKLLYEFMIVNDLVWFLNDVDNEMVDLFVDVKIWYWYLSTGLSKERIIIRFAQKLDRALSYDNEYWANEYKRWIDETTGGDLSMYVKVFNKIPAPVKLYFIEVIYNSDPGYDRQFMLNALGDSSKAVQNAAIDYFASDIGNKVFIEPLLEAKKKAVRDNAAKLMAIYAAQYNEEPNDGSNNSGDNVDGADSGDIKKTAKTFNALAYCTTNIPSSAGKNIAWTDFDNLPKIRMAGSENIAEDIIVKGYLYLILSQTDMVLPPAAAKIRECLNKDDLRALGQILYASWKNDGANAKRRGVLIIASIDGDEAFVNMLKNEIEEWAKASRGKLASDAVRAMALQGGNFALMTVDSIAKKFFHKQVKTAAEEAFGFAAEQLGVDPEVLADRIVPSLGFDRRGEQLIDYGTRQFTAVINPDLQITLKNADGKTIKSLPAPGANDDTEKAAKAKAGFSAMKKTLKSVVGIQCLRLELALADNRTWTKDEWHTLFVENPIMNMFAISLIWGLYDENSQLTSSFRYMEDGSFTDVDENEVIINNDGVIGLCHPLDLGRETVSKWQEQLSDYEIKQPLDQLSRKVFTLSADKKDSFEIDDFHGVTTYISALLNKLQKFGWRKGSIQDAGSYDTFYKEDKKRSIGVQLKFDGSYVGADPGEPATIFNALFYKAETVEYGSYCYDEIKEKDRIRLSEIPARLYSEICYDIERATMKRMNEE